MTMKEKPIIFNADSINAILDGRKTQTRRVMKPQPVAGVRFSPFVPGQVEDGHGAEMRCPYAVDRLWVRETWMLHESNPNGLTVVKYAPYDNDEDWIVPTNAQLKAMGYPVPSRRLRPSIFMPRWASRITLEVVSVRAERLQEISERDCCLEMGCAVEWSGPGPEPYKRDLRKSFGILWDSINAKRGFSWASNPWVWVVEFALKGGVNA